MAPQAVVVAGKLIFKPLAAAGRVATNIARATGKVYKHTAASVNKVVVKPFKSFLRKVAGPSTKAYGNGDPSNKVGAVDQSTKTSRAARRAQRRLLREVEKIIDDAAAKNGIKERRPRRFAVRRRELSAEERAAKREGKRNARIERAVRRAERKEDRRRIRRERRDVISVNRGEKVLRNDSYNASEDFLPAAKAEGIRDEARRDTQTYRVLQAITHETDGPGGSKTRAAQATANRAGVFRRAVQEADDRASHNPEGAPPSSQRIDHGRVLERGIG